MLSQDNREMVEQYAKRKYMMNYGPQGEKSISSAAGVHGASQATLQPQFSKNQSRATIASGSLMESTGRLTHASDLASQTIDLRIKSSRAFEVQQHQFLMEILDRVEGIANTKQRQAMERETARRRLLNQSKE